MGEQPPPAAPEATNIVKGDDDDDDDDDEAVCLQRGEKQARSIEETFEGVWP